MADTQSKDLAAKARIISHMNRDHQDSLIHYLEFFCRAPSHIAASAQLEDITFEHLILTTKSGTRNLVPLDPPLKSWGEARERTIQLDRQAAEGLGRSNITIKTFVTPSPSGLLVAFLATLSVVLNARRANFLPGSFIHDSVLRGNESLASFALQARPWMLTIVPALHVAEAAHFEVARLRRYNVPRFTGLWWKWLTWMFFEGIGCRLRFERLVRRVKAEKEGKKR